MLSTLDSWITSFIKDASTQKQGSENNNEVETQVRFEKIKLFILHTLLVLLHKPYVDEDSYTKNMSQKPYVDEESYTKNMSQKPSLEICSYSAMIITHMASQIESDEVAYLVRSSPFVLYALMTAIRMHLMNASCPADLKLMVFGEINFEKTMEILQALPENFHGSMLSESLALLQSRYQRREKAVVSGYTHSRLSSFGSDTTAHSRNMSDAKSTFRQNSSSSLESESGKRPLEPEHENLPPAKHTSSFKIICFNPSSSTSTNSSTGSKSSRQLKDKEKRGSKNRSTPPSRPAKVDMTTLSLPEQTTQQLPMVSSPVPDPLLNTTNIVTAEMATGVEQRPQGSFTMLQTYSLESTNYTQFTPPSESYLENISMKEQSSFGDIFSFGDPFTTNEPQPLASSFLSPDGTSGTCLDDQVFYFNPHNSDVFAEGTPSTSYSSAKVLWDHQAR
ncbi:hypothetical protein EC973_004495 [Apophysomyces ossiformis]|uniref:Uncharacterized protein n=1 Tax=Apophysomyces ossiformis TaxID=679940 RepID=A0A8H7ELF6_9FUNG|nr:hypothetical protein EC973_004495 [Apophysomyces ossiformis]